MNAHLALLEDRNARDGMAPDEAKLAARHAFGGVEQAKNINAMRARSAGSGMPRTPFTRCGRCRRVLPSQSRRF